LPPAPPSCTSPRSTTRLQLLIVMCTRSAPSAKCPATAAAMLLPPNCWLLIDAVAAAADCTVTPHALLPGSQQLLLLQPRRPRGTRLLPLSAATSPCVWHRFILCIDNK
jgi:hypothetical protein